MAYAAAPPRDPTNVLGRRIVAYVIDGFLVLIAAVAVLSLVRHDSYNGVPTNACEILRARRAAVSNASHTVACLRVGSRAWVWEGNAFLKAQGVAALLGIVDLVILQAVTGASLGKHALGLRVVDEQGRKAGFGRMIVRWLFLIIDGGIFLIGLITAIVTHPHRRVGDLAAGTYVVGRESAGRPIGIAPATVPYGAGAFAPPGYGLPPTPTWAPPTAPVPAPPSWGTSPAPAPAPPAWATTPPPAASAPVPPPPSASWGAPPTAPRAAAPPQSFPPPPTPSPQSFPPPPAPPPARAPSVPPAAPPAPPPSVPPPAPPPSVSPAPPSAPAPSVPPPAPPPSVPAAPPPAPPPSVPAAPPSAPPPPVPSWSPPERPASAPPPSAPTPAPPPRAPEWSPPVRPAPAPAAPPPQSKPPPAAPPVAPRPAQPAPAKPTSEREPEPWWNTAIPADPSDGEEQQP